MKSLKNGFAALGFVCFSSLALLPVSMTLCGPFTSWLLQPAKKIHLTKPVVKPAPFEALVVAQPVRTSFKRDMLRAEADPLRNLFEQIGAGRVLPGLDADGSGNRLIKRLNRSVMVSSFVFQPVLNL
jgi:hypothetical protein